MQKQNFLQKVFNYFESKKSRESMLQITIPKWKFRCNKFASLDVAETQSVKCISANTW